jgi:hypothetical protein
LKLRPEKLRLTSGPTLAPVKLTVCGLLGALSVMVRVPVSVPTIPAGGAKLTLIVQLAPPARVDGLRGQVLLWEKFALATML